MTRGFIIDAAERIAWTAVQAFAGSWIASGLFDNLGLSFADTLAIAGMGALLAVLKAILALKVGNDSTAQLGGNTYENYDAGPPAR